MEKGQIEIIPMPIPGHWMKQLPQNVVTGILFGGDRLLCCNYAAIAFKENKLLGLATIATKGEDSGQPTMVGIFVLPSHRRQGIAKQILIKAVEWSKDKGLIPLRIDSCSSKMTSLVNALPERQLLKVNDFGNFLDLIDNG